MKVLKVDLLIYRRSVIFFSRPTVKSVNKYMKSQGIKKDIKLEKIIKKVLKEATNGTLGHCLSYKGDVYIFTHKAAGEYVMLHEVYHAVSHIAYNLGIKCDEAKAYIYEYLVSQAIPWWSSK